MSQAFSAAGRLNVLLLLDYVVWHGICFSVVLQILDQIDEGPGQINPIATAADLEQMVRQFKL